DNNTGGVDDLTFSQLMAMYNQQSQQQNQPADQTEGNQAANLKKTAGTVGAIGGAVALGLQAIPVGGTIAGAVVGAGTAIASGVMDLVASGKQKQQAASDLAAGKAMKAAPLAPGLIQKAQADQMAADSPMPGWTQYHDALANSFAQHIRSIYNNSRNGGQAV